MVDFRSSTAQVERRVVAMPSNMTLRRDTDLSLASLDEVVANLSPARGLEGASPVSRATNGRGALSLRFFFVGPKGGDCV